MTDHVVKRVRETIAKHGARTATRIREGDRWVTQSYVELGDRIKQVAQGLLNHGMEAGGRVGIFLGNRPEWSEIDLGAGTVRAVPVPLYATSTPEQILAVSAMPGRRSWMTSAPRCSRCRWM